jgi:AraC-like DNA-binding protein
MRPRIPRVIAGGLAAAALTAALGGAAFAQVSSATPTAGPSAAAQQRGQEFLDALAAKLGKPAADVLAAFKAVEKDRVAQAVRDGRITQAEADRINAQIDQRTTIGPFGGPGFGGPGHKGGGHERGGVKGADPAALATFLGMQPADLRTALSGGKTLAQVAQEKGKSRDELKTFLTNQERTKLSQAVAAGRLTQAQADARLTQFTGQLDALIDRTGPKGGPGGERGPRGRGPGAGQGTPGAGQGTAGARA